MKLELPTRGFPSRSLGTSANQLKLSHSNPASHPFSVATHPRFSPSPRLRVPASPLPLTPPSAAARRGGLRYSAPSAYAPGSVRSRLPEPAFPPDGTEATRKPRLKFRFVGSFLPRFAARQYQAVMRQLPPRITRDEAFSGPDGLVTRSAG